MATTESAAALLKKRLRKAEQAQGRLGELARRIQAQADTIAELIKLTNILVGGGAPTAAARTSSSAKRAPAKPAPAKRAPVKRTPGRPAGKAATSARKTAPRRSARGRVVAPPEMIAATPPGNSPGSAI